MGSRHIFFCYHKQFSKIRRSICVQNKNGYSSNSQTLASDSFIVEKILWALKKGWWYGVVGHLETCERDANHCQCQNSDTLVLEFKQYTRGSRWRQTAVSRKDHREEGNEADGFYGGIRKLCSNEEISMWRKLWPAEVLE